MRIDTDVLVIGSGFAGSLAALCLRQRGFRVALVERHRHPRFAIGESSTPLANLLLEEIADRYELPRVKVFAKWGTWQRGRPEVACGLKRGFTFYFHRFDHQFEDGLDHARQLLVAASPRDEVADTHWYRPDFDRALVREALDAGADYVDETAIERFTDTGNGVVLDATRHGDRLLLSARFVIDASGPRGCLHRLLALPEAPLRWLPATQGLYTHFEDVHPWQSLVPPEGEPPYPVDAAAMHHVFDGGWIWVLRFNNGITSAGAAVTDAVAERLRARGSSPEHMWQQLLATLPSVAAQFEAAHAIRPLVHMPRVAFRSSQMHGDRWAMLPSAAGVIDPLLSTGFPLTLLGLQRLLRVLEATGEGDERRAALQAYDAVSRRELDAVEQLVAALYANMDDPEVFKRLTLLYFAAASFSEAARRIGRPALAPGFLLHARAPFGAQFRACVADAMESSRRRGADLLAGIDRAIEPIDLAGFRDRRRRDWYPVLAGDLLAAAGKLQAAPDEIEALLEKSGFSIDPTPL